MNRQKTYIPTLDGWRALAVIGVILYHGRSGFFTSGSHLSSVLNRLSAHGELGVDVFFAISGFLICGLLLQEHARDGHISLRQFYLRRCFRILPPYYTALAAICTVSLLGAIRVNYGELPSCLLFYRNYTPLGMDKHGGFYTAHFWSLALEEHFYLIWPMLLIAVKPKRAGKAAFLFAMVILVWRNIESHFELLSGILLPANLLSRSDTRMDALLWGCLAAIYFPAIRRWAERIPFSELWIPALAILLVAEALHVPGLVFWQVVLLPALILSTVIQPASVLGRVLEWRLLRWVGTLSYSLYLWQELFLPVADSERAHGAFAHLQHWPGNILALLVCACLSRYLLELPMTRLGHRLGAAHRGPTPARSSANSAQVAAAGGGL